MMGLWIFSTVYWLEVVDERKSDKIYVDLLKGFMHLRKEDENSGVQTKVLLTNGIILGRLARRLSHYNLWSTG